MKKQSLYILVVLMGIFFGCSNRDKKLSSKFHSKEIEALLVKSKGNKLDGNTCISLSDKIHRLINERENDSLTRDYLFQLAGSYLNCSNVDKYYKVSREVSEKCKRGNDLPGLTRSYYYIGNYHYLKFNTDSAYYYFSKAEKTSSKVKNRPYYGFVLFSKANLLAIKKDFSRSEELSIKALKIAMKEKNYRLVYDCYLLLGNSLLGINNYEKALFYHRKALKTADLLKSDFQYLSLKAQPFNYLGKVYNKMRRYKNAIICFEKGLSLGDFKKSDPFLYCYMINNLAYAKMKLGDETTGEHFKGILRIADSIHNIPVQITSKKYLSEYYNYTGDVSNAIFYAEEARKMAHENKIFEDELTCLEFLAKLDHKNHARYTERFISLTDSLQNIERAARDKYARIEFETDEIIKEKNYVISERDYLSNQRWTISVFSLLLISILTLGYVFTLQKSKNKELEFIQQQQKQNEEIYQLMLDQRQKLEEGKQLEKKRISQELHDGVMGRLSGIRLNLYALSRRTDEATIVKCLEQVPRLQEIEREIRNISHNLSSNMVSSNTNFNMLIKDLFQEMRNHSKMNFEIDIDPEIEWENISNYLKINIYRIIQEALFNIDKYAEAEKVYLQMQSVDEGISVSIEDNGVGFDLQKVKNGIGLKNIRSRVEDLKGKIDIVSKVGEGTKINFAIPL